MGESIVLIKNPRIALEIIPDIHDNINTILKVFI